MSNRHGGRPDTQHPTPRAGTHRRGVRIPGGLPRPTRGELATIWSVPALLLVVHFLVQPGFDAWVRFRYVRYPVAQTTPAHQLAPDPFTPYAWAWHEFTRAAHMLVHAPGGYHSHVVGNVALIVFTAWALLVTLTALGRRRWFVFCYWDLVVVAPVVGSFAFDLFGTTATGYGASTVGFAFLGVVVVVSLLALVDDYRRRVGERLGSGGPVRSDGGQAVRPLVVAVIFVLSVVVVAGDVLVASPAMPVHQAGAGFGAVVGAVVGPLTRRR